MKPWVFICVLLTMMLALIAAESGYSTAPFRCFVVLGFGLLIADKFIGKPSA